MGPEMRSGYCCLAGMALSNRGLQETTAALASISEVRKVLRVRHDDDDDGEETGNIEFVLISFQ